MRAKCCGAAGIMRMKGGSSFSEPSEDIKPDVVVFYFLNYLIGMFLFTNENVNHCTHIQEIPCIQNETEYLITAATVLYVNLSQFTLCIV